VLQIVDNGFALKPEPEYKRFHPMGSFSLSYRGMFRRRGSSASLSPSPSKLMERIVSMMARPGRVTSHHASVM